MILKMILKSFDFQCDFDLDFQITTSKMIWIWILNHLYLGDLILKSSTYDDFAHLCSIYNLGKCRLTDEFFPAFATLILLNSHFRVSML